jgi:hypothetical protein
MKVFFNAGYVALGHGADTNSDRLSQAVPSLRAQAANTFLAHKGNARNNYITRNEPKI